MPDFCRLGRLPIKIALWPFTLIKKKTSARPSHRFALIALSSLLGTAAFAQSAPVPEAPPIPPVYQGETIEPEVTILETDRGILYEYRVNGQLYMVRVQPPVGPPYYLLDTDGDGQLDVRQDRIWNTAIPQWLLYSW